MSRSQPRFHLAFPVTDLEAARDFYTSVLGCGVGREAPRWIDFDFRGHQITAHLVASIDVADANAVDGDRVPARHFGLILAWDEWESLAARLRARGTEFLIGPKVRFPGRAGEQATLFLRDPAGNALEFKSFRDDTQVFARESGASAAPD
ncbi:MAG: VOC family protein [Gammaproteobacteria bacterium]